MNVIHTVCAWNFPVLNQFTIIYPLLNQVSIHVHYCPFIITTQVIQGKPGADHAVELFVSTNTQPDQITELYIKESPCYTCSSKLIEHFRQSHKKPALFLAKIRHLHNVSDREGLRQLIQEGFDINPWTHLHYLMEGDDTTTREYIKELKNETTMYCYFGIYN